MNKMKAALPVFFIISFLAACPSPAAADLNEPEAVEEPAVEPDALAEYNKRFSQIKEGDAEAYYNLAVFCLDKDLPDQAEYLLKEAARDPVFERKAKRYLEKLTGEPDKTLYEKALKHYESGYLAEARVEFGTLKAVYPKSYYLRKARPILRKIDKEAADKPFLAVPVTDSPAEIKKIIDSFDTRATGEGRKAEDLKKEYFTDILKKAEYFSDTLAEKSAPGGKKEEYLSYAIKCAEEVYMLSDDAELKGKAEDLRSRITKQLFIVRPVSGDLKNISTYYEKLHLVKDSGFIEDVCGKYVKEGEEYLKKARKASGDEKMRNLVSAYKCFSFAYDYTKSAELKEATFKKMKIINKEKRKEIRKNKTSN